MSGPFAQGRPGNRELETNSYLFLALKTDFLLNLDGCRVAAHNDCSMCVPLFLICPLPWLSVPLCKYQPISGLVFSLALPAEIRRVLDL